jgi:MFS family permease
MGKRALVFKIGDSTAVGTVERRVERRSSTTAARPGDGVPSRRLPEAARRGAEPKRQTGPVVRGGMAESIRGAILGTDRRVLALAFARMADALGNSFLIVVLPLFITSGQVPLEPFTEGSATLLGVTVLDDGALRLGPVSLGLTESLLVGLALSLFGFLNSFGQPFTGRLSDRTGKRRRWILLGLALLGAASGALLFARSYPAVVGLRIVQGVGAAFTIPATVALVNELAGGRGRGSNFGVFNTFRLIGFGFGPIIAGVVIELFGFDAAFAVAVLGAATSFLLVSLLVSDPEETRAAAADDLSIAVSGDEGLLDPVFALGVATVCMAIGISLFATLEGQINDRLNQGTILFGLEFGAVTLANVVFQIPAGRASDDYGRRPFLVAGTALLVPTTLAQGIVTDPALMVLARFAQGAGVAMVFAPSLALAGDLARENESGTTLSVLTTAFGFGVAVGPLLSGYLVAYGFRTPFVVGSALAALALLLVVTQVRETVPTDAGAETAVPQD